MRAKDSKKEISEERSHLTLCALGDSLVVDHADRSNLTPLSRIVWVINPEYSFVISKKGSPTAPWTVDSILPGQSEGIRKLLANQYTRLCMPSAALGTVALKALITDPGFHITHMESLGSSRNVKIEFRYDSPGAARGDQPPEIVRRSGWMILDPCRYWRMTEYALGNDRGKVHTKVDYQGQQLGDRYPVRQVTTLMTGPGGERKEVFVTDEVSWTQSDDPRFTLPAYGFPAPVLDRGRPKRSAVWLWMTGAGILLGGVSLFLRRKLDHQAEERQQPHGMSP
jgi:hypothetical protein